MEIVVTDVLRHEIRELLFPECDNDESGGLF
jgi:hypothetical protein